MHFGVNSRQVMSETIDGETIVIHLGTGSYYSLQEAGADIWAAIARGANEAQILDELERRYDGQRDDFVPGVTALLGELQAEELVLQSPNGSGYAPAAGDAPLERAPFVEPKLEKHTDMQDIILLDPVHEVDDRGWPHASEAAVS